MHLIWRAGIYTPPDGGEPNHWIVHLNSGDMSLGTYSIPAGGVDDQEPHTEDEVYVVQTGRATLETPSDKVAVEPGSVIFVPAGETHKFTDITEDLALVVVFAPSYGSRSPSRPDLSSGRGTGGFLDTQAGQGVGALVALVARVTLHPMPADLMAVHGLEQPAP
jgi:mannose-6-phosphate isomerase-like protein (cupin superfamily)